MGIKMYQEQRYFIFNKQLDYIRGYSENLIYENHQLHRRDINKKGVFISRVLDSQETDMEWHRFIFQMPEEKSAMLHLRVYCSNENFLEYEGITFFVGELISSSSYSLDQKLAAMEKACVKQILKSSQILLHDVAGRFLWFAVELFGQEEAGIREIKVEFPKRTWMEYLPFLYQKEEMGARLLDRYLSICQTLYEDVTDEICKIPRRLDPDCASEQFLSWMAQWLSIEDIPIWGSAKLRFLLKNAMNLYRIRGTAAYMKKMIGLLTGGEAYIVEYHQIYNYRNNLKMFHRLKELYGENENVFTVLVNIPDSYTAKEYQILIKLAEHIRPAHMEGRMIQLKQYIFLDAYSYLGINARLGVYRPVWLDGRSALNFSKIQKETCDIATQDVEKKDEKYEIFSF